jgi:hypothetical protein
LTDKKQGHDKKPDNKHWGFPFTEATLVGLAAAAAAAAAAGNYLRYYLFDLLRRVLVVWMGVIGQMVDCFC